MTELVLATGNPHKVEELRAILASLPAISGSPPRILGLSDLTHPDGSPRAFPEPAEHGSTFEENAAIKALAYAHATNRLCIADDSGLEIDALDGRPGVISSHYCTDGREVGMTRHERDAANNQRILRELDGVPPERRTARFVCVIALAAPTSAGSTPAKPKLIATFRGQMQGRIGMPPAVPRGSHGFGYDPLFLVAPEFTHTGAELEPSVKNARSHRAAAVLKLAEFLTSLQL